VTDTAVPGDATHLARAAAADGVEVVVVCGGDGTLNEAANGLVGSETALALIPGGTGNVWAREVGIATDPAGALGLLGAGRRVRVDTGVVQIGNDPPRHFLLMCSAGVDAEAVRAVEQRPKLKRRLGRAAFGWPALRAIFAGSNETRLTVDGESCTVPLLMALAGNTQLYASVLRLTADALMDDGQLDLLTFEDAPPGRLRVAMRRASILARAVRSGLRDASTEGIRYTRIAHAELRPSGPLAVQADGEFIGIAGPDAPLQLWVEPRSLTMLVPAGVNSLFSRNGDR